jgi:hypothetical protein
MKGGAGKERSGVRLKLFGVGNKGVRGGVKWGGR